MTDWIEGLEDLGEEIEPEDRADYPWEVGSVEARLHAGDDVFGSEFERELYDRIAAVDGLVCVPQWPSRGKLIDLVVTDNEGRRLAIEADGEQHHEMHGDALIPEDVERQGLLEEVGWVFHRIRHHDFKAKPDEEIRKVLAHLAEQPANANLAARIRGDELPEYVSEQNGALDLQLVNGATSEQEPAATKPIDDADPSEPTAEVSASYAIAELDAHGRASGGVEPALGETATEDEVEAEADKEAIDEPEARRFEASMNPRQIESLLDQVSAELEEVEEPTPYDEVGDEVEPAVTATAAEEAPAVARSIGRLGNIRLSSMASYVGELVISYGSIEEGALVELFSSYYQVDVSSNLRTLLTEFARLAEGRGFVALNGSTWTPAATKPNEIKPFGDWTLNAVVEHARQLLAIKPEKEVSEQLLHEIYPTASGRVPEIATMIARKAIWQAQHS